MRGDVVNLNIKTFNKLSSGLKGSALKSRTTHIRAVVCHWSEPHEHYD
jgi:hypothetical protein